MNNLLQDRPEHRSRLHVEQANRAGHPDYFVGTESRSATVTDIALLSESRMVVAHLLGQTLMLYGRESKNTPWKLIDQIDTEFGGELTIVDLLHHREDGKIIASNFDACSGSIYCCVEDKLSYIRDVPLPPDAGNCHGAQFYDSNTACLQTNKKMLYVVDLANHCVAESLLFPYFIKDMSFIGTSRALAACSLGSPTPEKIDSYGSVICLVKFKDNFRGFCVIDELHVIPAAFDAIVFDSRHDEFYITDQFQNRVVVGRVVNDKITVSGQYSGISFAHGVDVLGDLIAVTSYGESTVSFLERSKSRLDPVTGSVARVSLCLRFARTWKSVNQRLRFGVKGALRHSKNILR